MKSILEVCLVVLTLASLALAQDPSKPMLREGIHVQMANAEHAVALPAADANDAVVVSVTADGKVFNGASPADAGALAKVIVVTAGQYWKPSDPKAAREIQEFHETWLHQLQPELARLSTRGKQVIAENSDHGIPEQAPDAVVSAVNEVVIEVRQRQN
jgi:hypothetical protein